MKKYYLLLFYTSFFCLNSFSQKPLIQLKWLNTAQSYDNGGDFNAEGISSCSDGSVVVVGYFNHTVDFDPGPDTFNITGSSAYNIFIAKYSVQGKLIFAYGFGGSESLLLQTAYSVATDADDNAYVTGIFSGDIDFNPGKQETILSSPTTVTNNFLVCFGRNGAFKFAKNITDSKETDKSEYAHSIVLDNQKNIYVAGSCRGTSVDFDPGPNNTAIKTKGQDIFFAKYDSLGNFLFLKTIGGTSYDEAQKITLDKNKNILICGEFQSGSIDFGSDTSSHILILKGKQDLFFAKYDSSGNYLFAKNIGGAGSDAANAIATASDNSFVITGYFGGKNINFDPGNGNQHLLTSNGNVDVFIARYDLNGNCVFAFNIGSDEPNDEGEDVAIDNSNNIICTGVFSGNTVDFDPDSTTFYINNSGYGYNYIAKYSFTGELIYAGAIGNDDMEANRYSSIDCLHLTNAGDILLGGYYDYSIDADAGSDSTILHSEGTSMVVYKYHNNMKFVGAINTGSYFNYYNAQSRLTASALDKKGNVYVAGLFNGRYDFDPGPGVFVLESLADYNNSGYFAKYNKQGKLIFAKALVGGNPAINDMAIDDDENIYLTGNGNSTTDFDPGDSVQHLFNGDSTFKKITTGYFYAKYNSAGDLVFAKGEGHSENINFTSIAVDNKKNIYLAGSYHGSLDFDPGVAQHVLSSGNSTNAFISKYDSSGNFVAVNQTQSATSTSSVINDLKINSANEIVVTGNLSGKNIDFDFGSQTYFLSSNNSATAGFISTYKLNGNFVGAFSVGTTQLGVTNFNALTSDAANNIYIAGFSTGSADFDPGNGVDTLSGRQGMFFASYTTNNALRFLKGISAYTNSVDAYNQLTTISLDKNDNIYVAGQFSSKDIDCDPGPDTAIVVNTSYGIDDPYYMNEIFFAKYDSLGNYNYSYGIEADSMLGYNNSTAILVDNDGNIDYTGYSESKLNFSTTSKKIYLQPTSLSYNMFVAQYKPTSQTKISNIASATKTVINSTVKVYPNPITDNLNIQLNNIEQNNSMATISLYDVRGRCLQTNRIDFSNHNLNTTIRLPQNLSSGNYFIAIDVEGKIYYSNALIK